MPKCIDCISWKGCFDRKEWDAAVAEICENFRTLYSDLEAYVIVHEGREDDYWEQCSVCGSKDANIDYNFCPNCGVRFRRK